MQQQDGDSLSGSLWKTGNGIVYQAESSLSALCRLHYSLCYVWETISVSCFLRCYLLVVPLEMGPGSGDLSSSQRGSLIKEANVPLCASEIRPQGMRKMSENLTAAICPTCRHPPG